MNLQLTIIKAAEGSDLLNKTIDVDMNGLSIGRAENNDLVLNNDLSISKQHAVIQYQHGDFYLYDISTNGVYLSDNLQALNTQENNFQLLKDTDTIRIGVYILKVSVGEHIRETQQEVDLESLMTNKSRRASLLAEEDDSNAEEDFIYNANPGEKKSLHDAPEEFDLDSFLRGESFDQKKSEDVQPLQDSSDLLEGLDIGSDNHSADKVANNSEESIKVKNADSFEAKLVDSHLTDLLFEELGLSHYKMDAMKQEEIIRQLVNLIKTTLQCMHDSVQKRQESLQNLGLTSISYKKTGNNPILFSANMDEALVKLLFPPKGETYLSIDEAIPQCFADLENYQYYLAMAAKETLQQTLDQFSPKAVAAVLADVEVKRGFFKRKSLINFNQYTAYYEKINVQSEGQLNRVMQKNVPALPNDSVDDKKEM
jgi:type VI secretion system protein ImpI